MKAFVHSSKVRPSFVQDELVFYSSIRPHPFRGGRTGRMNPDKKNVFLFVHWSAKKIAKIWEPSTREAGPWGVKLPEVSYESGGDFWGERPTPAKQAHPCMAWPTPCSLIDSTART